MAETKFTKGPWTWAEHGGKLMLGTRHQGFRVVLAVGRRGSFETRDQNGLLRELEATHPNAHLIAAAPELYEALKWFVDDIDGDHTVMLDFDANVSRARAALSKARGEA